MNGSVIYREYDDPTDGGQWIMSYEARAILHLPIRDTAPLLLTSLVL